MWHAFIVISHEAAREAVEYALMEAGALGTESAEAIGEGGTTTTDHLTALARTVGYFDAPPVRATVDAALAEALHIYARPATDVMHIETAEVPAHDWLGEWKKSWQPVAVGESFVIAPPWGEVEDAPGRHVIRIEPGMAFGTGTHETTRLCLAAIERHFRGGSFLDVGTGTGILAIAAAKLFPDARIEACDTDIEAVAIARENARLNHVAQINFSVGSIDDATLSADLVCANLTADVIVPLLPALVAATCGHLILSGILDTQAELVRTRLRDLGLNRTHTEADGEWVAIIL